ncbi:MAG: flagellar basal body rod protein FlgB [Planctomycetota bacterium]|nr:flagellar basal body rod protein FlgB [Planctomycetota bacterium]
MSGGIEGIFEGGSLPVLERLAQFTQSRHKVLVDNVANLSTPYYKANDLDPSKFQAQLRDAIDRRRGSANAANGPLEPTPVSLDSDESFGNDNSGVLFHDQNNRDLERIMQHLAENTLAHRTATELIRNNLEGLRTAIRERV